MAPRTGISSFGSHWAMLTRASASIRRALAAASGGGTRLTGFTGAFWGVIICIKICWGREGWALALEVMEWLGFGSCRMRWIGGSSVRGEEGDGVGRSMKRWVWVGRFWVRGNRGGGEVGCVLGWGREC